MTTVISMRARRFHALHDFLTGAAQQELRPTGANAARGAHSNRGLVTALSVVLNLTVRRGSVMKGVQR